MQKRIMNLGKALVEELRLDPGVDTLSRWMAHYIAEQMEIAENATINNKIEAEQRCFDTILKLWQHRSSLPNGQRPFERFEQIFRMLERLDPEKKQPFFYLNRNNSDKNKENENLQQWLDVAEGIDRVARIWLDYVFKQATLCATDERTIDWLRNSAGLQNIDDTSIIIRLLPKSILRDDENITENIQQQQHDLIMSRIEELKSFNDFNQQLLSILEQELEDLSVYDSLFDENDMK